MAVYKNQGSRLCCGRAQLLVFEHKYDYILLEGERLLEGLHPRGLAYKALSAMLNRLWTYKDAYMLFICDYKVPYTNNLAERDFRLCKSQQKVSGCFCSWAGVVCFAVLRSFISESYHR